MRTGGRRRRAPGRRRVRPRRERSSSDWAIASRVRRLTRSKSLASKRGRRTASARSGTPCATLRERIVRFACTDRRDAPEEKLPPRLATASPNASASRVAGALVEHARGEGREAGARCARVERAGGTEHGGDARERQVRRLPELDGDPVREPEALGRRGPEGRDGAVRGPGVARRRGPLRLLREDAVDDPGVLRQEPPRGGEDRGRRRLTIALEVALEPVRLAPRVLVEVQEVGAGLEALEGRELRELGRLLALGELARFDAARRGAARSPRRRPSRCGRGRPPAAPGRRSSGTTRASGWRSRPRRTRRACRRSRGACRGGCSCRRRGPRRGGRSPRPPASARAACGTRRRRAGAGPCRTSRRA